MCPTSVEITGISKYKASNATLGPPSSLEEIIRTDAS